MKDLWLNLQTSLRLFLTVGALVGGIGCATTLDTNLQAAVQTDRPLTAEEHLVAAEMYDQNARSQADAASQYERRVEALSPLMDPKGFRRAGLITAAQEHRRKAADMQQQYVFHQNQALALTGQAPR